MKKTIEHIKEFLKEGWEDDPASRINFLSRLASYKGTVNDLRDQAEAEYLEKLSEFYKREDTQDIDKWKVGIYKDKKEIAMPEITVLRSCLDRLSATITHNQESLKAILFHTAQEMKHVGTYQI